MKSVMQAKPQKKLTSHKKRTFETSTSGLQWTAWLGKATQFVGKNYYGTSYLPYFTRGENYTTSGGGPLSFGYSDGNSNAFMSFRMCLITK